MLDLDNVTSCLDSLHDWLCANGMAWILEFADGLNLVICNTLFMKQESKLVSYVAGPVKSTVDYIPVRKGDKAIRLVTSRSFQMKNVCQSINC